MSFQAYIDNIKTKTGKNPDDFKKLAEKKGFLKDEEIMVKATEITNWLKEEFELQHSKEKMNNEKNNEQLTQVLRW